MSGLMAPWLFEVLTLSVMGLSGLAIVSAAGLRHPLIMAGLALGLSAAMRLVLTLIDWSLGPVHVDTEVWWVISSLLAVWMIFLTAIRRTPHLWQSVAIYVGLMVVSLFTKYVAGIGERHHSDSANTVALSLLIIQQDEAPENLSEAVKRGLAYPLLLALGPDGRILGGLTPMIFLSTATLIIGISIYVMRDRVPPRTIAIAAAAVAVVLWTVPIVRVSMFYLNAHTLTGYATLMVVAGAILIARERSFTPVSSLAIAAGGLVAATSRGEGIIFAAIGLSLVAAAAYQWSVRDRIVFVGLVLVPIIGAVGWFESVGASVIDEFGFTPLLLLGVGFVAAAIVASPFVDTVREWIPWFVVIMLVAYVFGRPVLDGNPWGPVEGLWNNVVLGYGGWGVLFPLLAAGLILMGWPGRSPSYRHIALTAVAVVIGAMFAHNLFIGGFGRDGFYGSLNRMFLQATGVVALAALVGVAELFRSALPRVFGPQTETTSAPDYTEPVGRMSKDSPL